MQLTHVLNVLFVKFEPSVFCGVPIKKKKLVEHDELGRSSIGHSWVVFTHATLEGTVLALKRNGKKHAKGMPADVIFGIVLSA